MRLILACTKRRAKKHTERKGRRTEGRTEGGRDGGKDGQRGKLRHVPSAGAVGSFERQELQLELLRTAHPLREQNNMYRKRKRRRKRKRERKRKR